MPEIGAETSIYLASSEEVSGVIGKYFYRCAEAPSKPISYDITVAHRLWDLSRDLVGEDL